jgi:hypothetical protein
MDLHLASIILLHQWRGLTRSTEENIDDLEEVVALFLSNTKRKFVYSRNRKVFLKSLSREQRQIRCRNIPRRCLHEPGKSAWRKLYAGGNDAAMITFTGLDHCTFEELNVKFKLLFELYTPHSDSGCIERKQSRRLRRGRPRSIKSMDCLALVLAWTRTRGSMHVLQIIFGLTGAVVSVYLRFGRRLLVTILKREKGAMVVMPSSEKIKAYMDSISERHPKLLGVWCTMDGLKLLLEQAPESIIENRFYNGWTHDHYVGNVLVFCPDGTIPMACTNVPGKLECVYEEHGGGLCTVDSAFCKKANVFLLKSSQSLPDDPDAFTVNEEATSMKQSAEWGMRALQGSFPRIKDRFAYEERGERRLVLKMIVLLYNYRANKVGINQIRNTYMPALDVQCNIFAP